MSKSKLTSRKHSAGLLAVAASLPNDGSRKQSVRIDMTGRSTDDDASESVERDGLLEYNASFDDARANGKPKAPTAR
jgi:hypothetical protein